MRLEAEGKLPEAREIYDAVLAEDETKSGWLHFLSHQSYHLSLWHHWDNGL